MLLGLEVYQFSSSHTGIDEGEEGGGERQGISLAGKSVAQLEITFSDLIPINVPFFSPTCLGAGVKGLHIYFSGAAFCQFPLRTPLDLP